jgi:peptidylprolyl isomerase
MNRFSFALLFAAAALAASAQTPSKPSTSTTPAAKSSSQASTTSATKSSATAGTTAPAPWIKLPPGVPAVAHGPLKSVPITVHYEDIKIGTGPVGESGKLWHFKYTGWRAADGVKFDSWDEHQQPVMGADGKPELGPDGQPRREAQPASLPQGIGAVIPGFDYGLAGMRIGGKRRIFIPWQLAYGMRPQPPRPSPNPAVPSFPGIPPKSDLIFDVELVEVTDMPPPRSAMQPTPPRPAMPPHPASPQPSAAPAQSPVPAQSPTAAPAPTAPPAPTPPPAPVPPPPK